MPCLMVMTNQAYGNRMGYNYPEVSHLSNILLLPCYPTIFFNYSSRDNIKNQHDMLMPFRMPKGVISHKMSMFYVFKGKL